MLNDGPISWASRLGTVTHCNIDNETSAACDSDAAKENAFLRDLCHEMGTTQKVVQMNAHESKVHPDRVMGEATHPIPRGQCKCRMFGLQPPVECVAEESPHGKAIQPSR